MCGIAGYVSSSSIIEGEKILESFIHGLSHRGPDFQKYHIFKNVGFAHTRLKILDLSDIANQPFNYQDYSLIFNGEIYNHQELRKSITFSDFKSHSDTETLLHGLIEHGEAFIRKLNGMFAFAFLNLKDNSLVISRDRFGVKQVYYTKIKDTLYFSSEIKPLLKLEDIDKSVDDTAKEEYRTFLSCQGDKTIYKNIKKLPPAHTIKIDLQTIDIQEYNYWEIPTQRTYIKDAPHKIIDTTEELLVNAIKRQLMADVPIGFFLSGGLDSSLLVALAQQKCGIKKPYCYTIKQDTKSQGFENDYPFAIRFAEKNHIDLRMVEEAKMSIELINKVLEMIEEPIPDLSAINVDMICQKAKEENIKVLMSGLGADDIFTGYRRHIILSYHHYLRWFPIKSLKKWILNTDSSKHKRMHKLMDAWDKDPNVFMINLLKQHASNIPNTYFEGFLERFDKNIHPIDKALALEQISYLAAQNLLYTDKISMKHGVEVRVPYLDNELVDYSYNIPSKLKIKGFTTKLILREIAKKYLPKEIIQRSKTGFSQPIQTGIKNDLYQLLSDPDHLLNRYDQYSPQYLLNLYAVRRITNL